MNKDEKYIQRCIELASNGLGYTYPNPLVGSVIVHKEKIIGEGWHRKAGESHAEINAINSVKDSSVLKESEIYVSLEPCSHFGRTPPCALKIIELQFKKVIIGTLDPNPKVNGKGLYIIRKAGIEAKAGILENECKELNRRFNTFHLKKRPYITLKWAETLNKRIDNGTNRNQPYWISNKFSLQKIHQLRSQEQAILIGKNTALIDNPSLTTRILKGKNPLRIVIDKNLEIPESFNIFNKDASSLILNQKITKQKNNIEYIQINFSIDIIPQILDILYEKNIQSIIVEGGEKTLETFINNNLWDEAVIITSNTILKEGTSSPFLFGEIRNQEYYDNNLISYIFNTNSD